jgi:phosphoribosylanthranilate isomerase
MSTIATIATAVSPLLTLSVGLFMRHKIQEVHVMVNDRMSATVQLLTDALQDNVRLKDQAGEPPGPPAVAPPASPAAAAATTVVVAAAAAAAEVAKEEEAGKLQ